MGPILLVEDEPDLAEPLVFALEQDGHTVEAVSSGEEALARLVVPPLPSLVLLDLMLPDISGVEVCRRIRDDPSLAHIAVIMVTARADEYDKVVGFEAGADDYITKPYSLREIRLRVAALLRRMTATPPPTDRTVVRSGPFQVDTGAHTATVRGEDLALSVVEFRLLTTFVRHPGQALSRAQIRAHTWGDDYAITDRAVDTNIKRLRDRLGDDAVHIETVRGVGYRWSPEARAP